MANLDTENKRRSATGIFHLYTIPKYDGGMDAVDREHVTYIYAGITPTSKVPGALAYDFRGTGVMIDGLMYITGKLYNPS